MNKKFLVVLIAAAVLIAAGSWLVNQPSIVLAKGQRVKFSLPANAVQVTDNLYSLGRAHDKKSGKQVEGYAIIHRKDGTAKPSGAKTRATACYGFLAKDAKWKWLEPWVVNPNNTRGLDQNFVFDNLALNIGKWESAASYNILGDGVAVADALVADTVAPDNQNEVYFADIANRSVGRNCRRKTETSGYHSWIYCKLYILYSILECNCQINRDFFRRSPTGCSFCYYIFWHKYGFGERNF